MCSFSMLPHHVLQYYIQALIWNIYCFWEGPCRHKSVYWRCVHVLIFCASATGCVNLCVSMFFNITSKPVHLHTPTLSYNNTSKRVHPYVQECACAHFPCFRNWLCMSSDLRCRVLVCRMLERIFLPNGKVRFGGSTWCISSDLHCRANLRIFCLNIWLCFESAAHHPNLRKRLLKCKRCNKCSFYVFSHGTHSPSWVDWADYSSWFT